MRSGARSRLAGQNGSMAGQGRSDSQIGWPDEALVGRGDLLHQLTTAADDAAHGAGSVVLLTGEAGIGKTSAVRALARQGGDRLATTWGRCSVDRSAPPFWPWRPLLADEPAASEATGGPSWDSTLGAQRFERLNDLRDQVLERARAGPMLHVIEDLQWADVSSV